MHRIALTPGEPAGIGPDLAVAMSAHDWPAEIVLIADPALIEARARTLGIALELHEFSPSGSRTPARAGHAVIAPVELNAKVTAGTLDPANAGYVLATLRQAVDGCTSGLFDAMTTGPVNKGVMNDAGIPFTGHTEFLAERTKSPLPVMLLVAGDLRVALVTTHLPLRDVPDAVTGARLAQTIGILNEGLSQRFGIASPRISVLGLNPHAGESGHLGHEDAEIIEPVLNELRRQGLQLIGPLPADTAFIPAELEKSDAVLAMYHDQGLPVLKHRGFGHAVNVTLGLPIVRTSVDHGTALDLAGTGRADAGSLHAALSLACDICKRRAT